MSALNITKSLKIKCLHEPEVRGEGSAQYGVVAVIDQQSETVNSTYLTKKAIGRMSAGKFYMIRKVVVTDIIRVREESLIMNTSPFTFDENIEKDFLTPPKVGVLEALGSPRKRKLTISGVVKEVSNIIEKNGTKRRMIKLSDVANDETIMVKVWGEKVSIAPTIASQVALTHVVVNDYGGKKELNSTALTAMEDSKEEDLSGEIEAAGFEVEDIIIVVNDDVYSLTKEQMEMIFPAGEFVPGKILSGKRNGFKITAIYMNAIFGSEVGGASVLSPFLFLSALNITKSLKVKCLHEPEVRGEGSAQCGVVAVIDQQSETIMNTSPFAFEKNIETKFLTPPKVGVLEALGSPRKRKPSVSGVVKEDSKEEELHGEIEASAFEVEDIIIVFNDDVYSLTTEQMNMVFPAGEFVPGKIISGKRNGFKITAIDEVA
ncbi:hypothetical protein ScPMuIL_009911 [Solemya velum]